MSWHGPSCDICGGFLEDIVGGDGIQCDSCGLMIRSDGSEDYSEFNFEDVGDLLKEREEKSHISR